MNGHRARLRRPLHLVGQRLEPHHVGAGPADAVQRAEDEGGPEAVRKEGHAEMGQHGRGDRGRVDLARLDAVRHRQQDRHGRGVRAEHDAGKPARLGVAEGPFREERRQQRRKGHGPDLSQGLRQAEDGDDESYPRAELHTSYDRIAVGA